MLCHVQVTNLPLYLCVNEPSESPGEKSKHTKKYRPSDPVIVFNEVFCCPTNIKPVYLFCPPSTSSAVGRLLWFQSDGPGVGRDDVSSSMDSTGVDALVELVGNNTKVSVLHDDVARDGGQDLLAVFVPAAGNDKLFTG